LYFIGLISGTSVDGIDAVLASFPDGGGIDLLAHRHQPYPDEVREQVLALTRPGENEIERMGELDTRLGAEFAAASLSLLADAGVSPGDVGAIGSHGQTIRHHHSGGTRFTVQIGSPAVIAERTGITTIADFRAGDIAAGGQGAPLVPAFHQFLFRSKGRDRAVVNIGGIANITRLPGDPAVPVIGFDTGPGNTLMDRWIQRHRQQQYDENGAWARSGRIVPELLDRMLADPYFSLDPPKSTGQELFNLDWLLAQLSVIDPEPKPEDVQATLLELTAASITQALTREEAPHLNEVFICGGGAHNQTLMTRLQESLGDISVDTTAVLGLDPDWVEAAAFAWLARQRLSAEAGNLPSVTGAQRPVVLGGIYAPSPGAPV
jgi:anhydro-N-acetylmuramic acid kinase